MSVEVMGRIETGSSPRSVDELEAATRMLLDGPFSNGGDHDNHTQPAIEISAAPAEQPNEDAHEDDEREAPEAWLQEWLEPNTKKTGKAGHGQERGRGGKGEDVALDRKEPVRKSVILRRAGITKLPPAYALLADLEAAIPQQATISEMPAPTDTDPSPPPPVDVEPELEPSPPPPVPEDPSETGSDLNELDQLLETLNSPALLEFEQDLERDKEKDESADQRKSVGSLQPTPSSMGSRPDVNHLLDELQSVVSDSDSPHSAGSPVTASSATRDLDALMASLRDFEMTPKPKTESPVPDKGPESQYAQPIKRQSHSAQPTPLRSGANSKSASRVASNARLSQLDSMIGHLQSDMNRAGISTSAKGTCSACQKSIVGQVITALGRTWHPEHFVCVQCDQELATVNFFERDGKAYCEDDYHKTFAPHCAHCNGPILERCMSALGKTFHPEHFFCAHCGKVFGTSEAFHERDGLAFCRDDYFERFAPKCGACSRPIVEAFVTALGQQWHPECFNCMECGQPFKDGNFLEHNSKPYCAQHYHMNKGSAATCYGCKKTVSGRVLTAMGRKYHAEHFVCSFCLKQLNMGTFKEQKDRPYCMSCHTKLFG